MTADVGQFELSMSKGQYSISEFPKLLVIVIVNILRILSRLF